MVSLQVWGSRGGTRRTFVLGARDTVMNETALPSQLIIYWGDRHANGQWGKDWSTRNLEEGTHSTLGMCQAVREGFR